MYLNEPYLQGAVDGGLDIPHSVKRFPGKRGVKILPLFYV